MVIPTESSNIAEHCCCHVSAAPEYNSALQDFSLSHDSPAAIAGAMKHTDSSAGHGV